MILKRAFLPITALGIVLFSVSQAWAESWSVTDLMREMSAIKHSQASFVEERYSFFLKQPLIIKGNLSFTAPDTLIKHSLSPNDERLEVAGDRIHIRLHREGKQIERELSVHSYPALLPLVQGVRSTLAGNLPTLQQHYTIKLDGGRDDWHLLLTPKDDPHDEEQGLDDIIKNITIHGKGAHIEVVEINESDGDRSIMNITAK